MEPDEFNKIQPKQQSRAPAVDFALLLETACENFEIMQMMIKEEIKVEPGQTSGQPSMHTSMDIKVMRAGPCIQMALAKSFVANVIRAYRVCRDGARHLAINKSERDRFKKSAEKILSVRDVNEHGYDVKKQKETSKPSMHTQASGNVMLDETSMVIFGPEKIFMGPVNLFDVYCAIDRMRDLAGFKSLPRQD